MFQHEARPFEISAMKPNAKNMLQSHANIRDPRADWFYKSHFLRNPNVSCQRLVERKYEIFLETFKLKGVRNKFWKAETEYFYVLCWCVMVIKSYLFSLSLYVCSLHIHISHALSKWFCNDMKLSTLSSPIETCRCQTIFYSFSDRIFGMLCPPSPFTMRRETLTQKVWFARFTVAKTMGIE